LQGSIVGTNWHWQSLRERKNSSIGYFVAMLCSPLAIGVHGKAIGIDDAPELAAQKCF
jgi:hypothetical protein